MKNLYLFLTLFIATSLSAQYCDPFYSYGPDNLNSIIEIKFDDNAGFAPEIPIVMSEYFYDATGSFGITSHTMNELSIDVTIYSDDYLPITCGLWIDWNDDEDFSDAGETYPTYLAEKYLLNKSVAIFDVDLSGAPGGVHRARIRTVDTDLDMDISACSDEVYGGALDFVISVQSVSNCSEILSYTHGYHASAYELDAFSFKEIYDIKSFLNESITYADKTNLKATVMQGEEFIFLADQGFTWFDGAYIRIFVDSDDNGVFSSDEELGPEGGYDASFGMDFGMFIPEDLTPGEHLMRVRIFTSESAGICEYTPAYKGFTTDYTLLVEEAVAISDVQQGININIYPNPTSDQLVINTELINYTIEILNLNGEKIMVNNTASLEETMDVSSLPEGMYFVLISDGERTEQIKLIIQ